MLAHIADFLICPVCGGGLQLHDHALQCPAHHSFDVARQGYVNLLGGGAVPGTADTGEMVQARAEFLAAGYFRPLAAGVAAQAAGRMHEGLVVDAGAGTGYYLSAVLNQLPNARGLALDISKFALRRAARAHSHASAVVWDVWRPLPVRSGVASLVLNVFAPRNSPEFRRILRPDGTLLVVTPTARHLQELVSTLGLLSVDQRKEERLEESLASDFLLERREEIAYGLSLDTAEVHTLVRMGPSAHHLSGAELASRMAGLAEPFAVTAGFTLSIYRPRP